MSSAKTPDKSADEDLALALDKLDKLLKEMSDEPGGLNAASLERLQHEMTTRGCFSKYGC